MSPAIYNSETSCGNRVRTIFNQGLHTHAGLGHIVALICPGRASPERVTCGDSFTGPVVFVGKIVSGLILVSWNR